MGVSTLLRIMQEHGMTATAPEQAHPKSEAIGFVGPLVIGVGIFVTGLALMLIGRTQDGRYWQERPSVADPDVVHGRKRPQGDPDGLEG